MKKLNVLTRMLLLVALLVGSTSSAWAQATPEVSLDFTDNTEWGFPSGSSNKTTTENSYSAGGYTIKLGGGGSGNGYYFNTSGKYLLLGKTNATLTLPAFSFNVNKIVLHYSSGVSTSNKQNIYVGSTAVSTEATASQSGSNDFNINSSYQTAGNIYKIVITSNNNCQLVGVDIYKAPEAKTPSLSFPEASYNATLGAAFVNPVLTNNSDGTLTYTSSNEDVATVTNAGVVTLKACGSTTITANTTATGNYKAGSTSYTLNVNAVVAPTITWDGIEYASGSDITKKAGKTLTFTTTAPDAEIWYTTDGTTPDPTAGTPVGTLYTTPITVNASATYKAVTYVIDVEAEDVLSTVATLTANVTTGKETPTFEFESTSEDATYGADFTEPVLTNSSSETPTYSSSNTKIATVNSSTGEVTILSVGEVVISASVDENEDYKAAEASYTITVAENNAAPAIPNMTRIFYESFDKNNGSGGNDDTWSGITNTSGSEPDNTGWAFAGSYYKANKCQQLGKGSGEGSATTPELSLEAGVNYTLKFKAGWWSDKSGTFPISGTNCTVSPGTPTASTGAFANCSATVTTNSDTDEATITFATGGNKRLFIDEIELYEPITPAVDVTVPTSGWGTYCSPYPLDFTNAATEVTAYAVSDYNAAAGTVTFAKITSKVPAKTPIVINGETGSKKIAVAEGETSAPDVNRLRGYLSPTYYAGADGSETLMGLSGGTFKKMNAGTIPANKAVLVMDTDDFNSIPDTSKMTFIFVDDATETDGISNHNVNFVKYDGNAYNLAGQRVGSDYKGVVIVNGKKVVRK